MSNRPVTFAFDHPRGGADFVYSFETRAEAREREHRLISGITALVEDHLEDQGFNIVRYGETFDDEHPVRIPLSVIVRGQGIEASYQTGKAILKLVDDAATVLRDKQITTLKVGPITDMRNVEGGGDFLILMLRGPSPLHTAGE